MLRSVRPNRPGREHSDSRSGTGWDSGYPGRLAPINGAEVLRLQRLVGNQALTTLLRASPPGTAADRIVVQRRRGQFPEDTLIKAGLREFGYPEKKAGKLPAAGLQGHVNQVFDGNAVKGRGYWDGLRQTAARFQDEQQRPQLIAELEQRQQDYDRRFTEQYEHWHSGEHGDPYTGASQVWSTVGGRQKVPYANRLQSNGNAHTLVAEKNFGKYDQAPAPHKLNNSEILWQQYKGLRAQARLAENDTTQEAEDLRKLHQVERSNVVNPETIVTFYCSYETGVSATERKDWVPGAEEFFALLGTDNLKGVTFLLKDHMNQLGKTIRRVSTQKVGAKVMIWIDLVDL